MARRRRRATLAGFGSTLSVTLDEATGVFTAATGGAKRSAGIADRDDVDDELSAVRGAAAWAMDLLLAPGSAAVRSVGQCRLTVPQPVLKAPMVSALETIRW